MLAVGALAAVLVVLGPGESARDLAGDLDLLEDPAAHLTLADVTAGPAAGRFIPFARRPGAVRSGTIRLGFSTSAFWLRAELDLPRTPGGWLLHVATSQLDQLDVHVRAASGAWRTTRTGDLRPASARDVAHPELVVRLPDGRSQLLLRIHTEGAVTLPIRVVRAERFWREDRVTQLAWGVYLGFLAAMAIYNAFLWTVVRDRSYLYYVSYLIGFALFQASLSGHAALYLWPGAPGWGDVAPVVFLGTSVGAAVLFVRRMVAVRTTAPRLHRPLGVLAVGYAVAPLAVLVDFATTVRVMSALGVVALLSLAVPIVIAVRAGQRPARWLLLAYAAVVPGGVLFGLRYAGLVGDTMVTRHAIQVSTALEAMLLSFALADRINLLTRERAAAQTRLLDAQERERRRIAHELHDGLGQGLLALANRLRREVKRDGDDSPLAPLSDDARTLIGDVRRIAHDLHPADLDRLGLSEALRIAAETTLAPAGVEVACHIDPADGLLPPAAELHLYRLAQEAVANVARHARAARATVALEHHGSLCVLVVEDDGRGLPDPVGDGLGLAGMRERARLLDAELSIAPAHPGATPAGGDARGGGPGVRVRVEIPLGDAGRPGRAAAAAPRSGGGRP